MKTNKEIKDIVQRVLDCTLWNHLPYESMDIVDNESLKTKYDIIDEISRQRFKLEKQRNKLEEAHRIILAKALGDHIDAYKNNGERFPNPGIQISTRYKLFNDFIKNVISQVYECELDPDTISDIVLDIPYKIDKDKVTDSLFVSHIKEALEDLWFVSSVQPIYEDKYTISEFICKCNLKMIAESTDTEEEKNTSNKSDKKNMKINIYKMVINTIYQYINQMEDIEKEEANAVFLPIITRLLNAVPNYYADGDTSVEIIISLYYPTSIPVSKCIPTNSINGLRISITYENTVTFTNTSGIYHFTKYDIKLEVKYKEMYDHYAKILSDEMISNLFGIKL